VATAWAFLAARRHAAAQACPTDSLAAANSSAQARQITVPRAQTCSEKADRSFSSSITRWQSGCSTRKAPHHSARHCQGWPDPFEPRLASGDALAASGNAIGVGEGSMEKDKANPAAGCPLRDFRPAIVEFLTL